MKRAAGLLATACMVALVLVITGRPASSARAFDGQQIFRFDTFGDEQLWTNVLQHARGHRDRVAGDRAGGRVSRSTSTRCRRTLIDALAAGQVDLTTPP